MRTHHRFISSILSLSLGIPLVGIGIAEPVEMADVFFSWGLPDPFEMFKYMAFVGIALIFFGTWQFVPLFRNWKITRRELEVWASKSRSQALFLGIVGIVVGTIIALYVIWAVVASVNSNGSVKSKSRVLVVPSLLSGGLIWSGWTILNIVVKSK